MKQWDVVLCAPSQRNFKENDEALVLSVWCSWKSKLKQLIRDRGIMGLLVAAIYIVFFPSAILKHRNGGFACVCVTVCAWWMISLWAITDFRGFSVMLRLNVCICEDQMLPEQQKHKNKWCTESRWKKSCLEDCSFLALFVLQVK